MDWQEKIRPSVWQSGAYSPPTGRRLSLKLDLNESYHFISPEILEELRNFDQFILSSYPEEAELLSQLAQSTGRQVGEICLTAGSDQAIQLLLGLLFQAGDRVVVPAPTFFVYFSILNLLEAKVEPIFYRDEGQTFSFPLAETLAALTPETKSLLLCNPNNPLGPSIGEADLLTVLERAHTLNIPVIIDEAYFEFSGHTAANQLNRFDNLIIIRSFSKAFGLAGLRLGYVLAPSEVISQLRKVRLPWAVSHFSVFAGQIVLRHREFFAEKVRVTIKVREELADYLRKAGLQFYNTDANFLILKPAEPLQMLARLKEQKILVNDVSHYPYSGDLLKNALRVTIPAESDLERLRPILLNNQP